MYYVYAIRSLTNNYIYVGLTNNLVRRLAEHNKGQNQSTKPYRPFDIIYFEIVSNRQIARIIEKYLKSTSGKRQLRIIRDHTH